VKSIANYISITRIFLTLTLVLAKPLSLVSNGISPREQNRAYRLLIDKIIYDREKNGVTLGIV